MIWSGDMMPETRQQPDAGPSCCVTPCLFHVREATIKSYNQDSFPCLLMNLDPEHETKRDDEGWQRSSRNKRTRRVIRDISYRDPMTHEHIICIICIICAYASLLTQRTGYSTPFLGCQLHSCLLSCGRVVTWTRREGIWQET